jgi:hypothetical protein
LVRRDVLDMLYGAPDEQAGMGGMWWFYMHNHMFWVNPVNNTRV